MKTKFRLYADAQADFNSTIFDLISGDKETKQTKGLAYTFYQYQEFLFAFLKINSISNSLRKALGHILREKEISSLEISAERSNIAKKRADIIIKIGRITEPSIALVIEAKSIKGVPNKESLAKQIIGYMESEEFSDLLNYKKVGVVITKYNESIPDVACVSWSDIIKLLEKYCVKCKGSETLQQYFNFIIGIDKGMRYYEKEVLSIPAGRSIIKVEKHKIYECPNNKYFNHKKALFVTFRHRGSIMKELYKIDEILILNPSSKNEIESFNNSTFSEEIKVRILNYIEEYKTAGEKKFYILSESEIIPLMNMPKIKYPFRKYTYFNLSEILTEKELIVESQKKRLSKSISKQVLQQDSN